MRRDETTGYPVSDLIVGLGEKHLVAITADAITTTATLNHPYWLADQNRWIPAGALSVTDAASESERATSLLRESLGLRRESGARRAGPSA